MDRQRTVLLAIRSGSDRMCASMRNLYIMLFHNPPLTAEDKDSCFHISISPKGALHDPLEYRVALIDTTSPPPPRKDAT
eukprot:scaffold26500_cov93-Skeletonema_dohrnii-CCMP3373.AAC.4